MKSYKTLIAAAALATAILASGTAAFAKSQLTVSIPFEFYVQGTLLPAGDYTLADTDGHGTLRISGAAGKALFVITGGGAPNAELGKNRLVFRRYGESRFLAGIYWSESHDGLEVLTSPTEIRIAQGFKNPSTLALNAK